MLEGGVAQALTRELVDQDGEVHRLQSRCVACEASRAMLYIADREDIGGRDAIRTDMLPCEVGIHADELQGVQVWARVRCVFLRMVVQHPRALVSCPDFMTPEEYSALQEDKRKEKSKRRREAADPASGNGLSDEDLAVLRAHDHK